MPKTDSASASPAALASRRRSSDLGQLSAAITGAPSSARISSGCGLPASARRRWLPPAGPSRSAPGPRSRAAAARWIAPAGSPGAAAVAVSGAVRAAVPCGAFGAFACRASSDTPGNGGGSSPVHAACATAANAAASASAATRARICAVPLIGFPIPPGRPAAARDSGTPCRRASPRARRATSASSPAPHRRPPPSAFRPRRAAPRSRDRPGKGIATGVPSAASRSVIRIAAKRSPVGRKGRASPIR